MRNIREAFVGFGEINTPCEMIDDRCKAAAAELRKKDIEIF